MVQAKEKRSELIRAAVLIIAGCAIMIFACGWSDLGKRFHSWECTKLYLGFAAPYAVLTLLFAAAALLSVLGRVRAASIVLLLALGASAAMFAYDSDVDHLRYNSVRTDGTPYYLFWWWYHPAPPAS